MEAASNARRRLYYPARRHRQQVAERTHRLVHLRGDLPAGYPRLLWIWAGGVVTNRWFLRLPTRRDCLPASLRLQTGQRQVKVSANVSLTDTDLVENAHAVFVADVRWVQRVA